MSFVYTSNSPEYLNYIASTKTRDDIKNDPKLCVLLEDPYIKDNTELAILYREALYGDYAAKKEYVGFFLANGPELDTDTIMYHREKILLNPSLYNTYKGNFKNIESVYKLREEKYNKPVVRYSTVMYDEFGNRTYDGEESNTNLDCLQNPCEYLGPFSSTIGIVGDKKNFNTLTNVFSRISENAPEEDSAPIWGNIREHMIGKIVPEVEHAYHQMMKFMGKAFGLFAKELKEKNLSKSAQTVGDKKAEEKAEKVSAMVKTEIVSQLGDCSRLWERMRRLRTYDPSKNTKKPFDTIDNIKNADGTLKRNYQTQDDTSLKAPGLTFTYGGEGKTWVYTKPSNEGQSSKTSDWTPPFALNQPSGVANAVGMNAINPAAVADNSDIAGRIMNAGLNVGAWCKANQIWYHGKVKEGHGVQMGRKLKSGEGSGLTWISPVATDCSGGVWWVLSEAGFIKNPLSGAPSSASYRNNWSSWLVDGYEVIEVSKEQIQSGDIVLWDKGQDSYNHVAIYVSSGKFFDFGTWKRTSGGQPQNRSLTFKGAISTRVWRIVPKQTAATV